MTQFNDDAEELIQLVQLRLPSRWMEGINDMVRGGEYEMAVQDIASIVTEERILLQQKEWSLLTALVSQLPGQEHLMTQLMELGSEED